MYAIDSHARKFTVTLAAAHHLAPTLSSSLNGRKSALNDFVHDEKFTSTNGCANGMKLTTAHDGLTEIIIWLRLLSYMCV